MTLRTKISDLVNDLNKLWIKLPPGEESDEVRKTIRLLMALWQAVIEEDIDASTPKFRKALETLTKAEKDAKDALVDLEKAAKAIETAAKAAKAVDKIVGLVAKLLA